MSSTSMASYVLTSAVKECRRTNNIIPPVPRTGVFPAPVVPGRKQAPSPGPSFSIHVKYQRTINLDATCALFAPASRSNLLTFTGRTTLRKEVLLRSIQTSAFMWQQTDDTGCPRPQMRGCSYTNPYPVGGSGRKLEKLRRKLL